MAASASGHRCQRPRANGALGNEGASLSPWALPSLFREGRTTPISRHNAPRVCTVFRARYSSATNLMGRQGAHQDTSTEPCTVARSSFADCVGEQMSARLQHTIAVVSCLAAFALISAIIGEVVH